ncbi:hypothetical protein HYW76_04850 [Candidatus Pacearchaeota archaeon]|nr:hypothetical protein [Candidatus Pacearchaeota archaeon]
MKDKNSAKKDKNLIHKFVQPDELEVLDSDFDSKLFPAVSPDKVFESMERYDLFRNILNTAIDQAYLRSPELAISDYIRLAQEDGGDFSEEDKRASRAAGRILQLERLVALSSNLEEFRLLEAKKGRKAEEYFNAAKSYLSRKVGKLQEHEARLGQMIKDLKSKSNYTREEAENLTKLEMCYREFSRGYAYYSDLNNRIEYAREDYERARKMTEEKQAETKPKKGIFGFIRRIFVK